MRVGRRCRRGAGGRRRRSGRRITWQWVQRQWRGGWSCCLRRCALAGVGLIAARLHRSGQEVGSMWRGMSASWLHIGRRCVDDGRLRPRHMTNSLCRDGRGCFGVARGRGIPRALLRRKHCIDRYRQRQRQRLHRNRYRLIGPGRILRRRGRRWCPSTHDGPRVSVAHVAQRHPAAAGSPLSVVAKAKCRLPEPVRLERDLEPPAPGAPCTGAICWAP